VTGPLRASLFFTFTLRPHSSSPSRARACITAVNVLKVTNAMPLCKLPPPERSRGRESCVIVPQGAKNDCNDSNTTTYNFNTPVWIGTVHNRRGSPRHPSP
jgi:hypothetical protein